MYFPGSKRDWCNTCFAQKDMDSRVAGPVVTDFSEEFRADDPSCGRETGEDLGVGMRFEQFTEMAVVCA